MATSDLLMGTYHVPMHAHVNRFYRYLPLAELSKEAFKPDSEGERKICGCLLKLINDRKSCSWEVDSGLLMLRIVMCRRQFRCTIACGAAMSAQRHDRC